MKNRIQLSFVILIASLVSSIASPQWLINGFTGTTNPPVMLLFNSTTNQTGVFPALSTNVFNYGSSVSGVVGSVNTNIWPSVGFASAGYPNTYVPYRHMTFSCLFSNMNNSVGSVGHQVCLADSGDGNIWQTNAFVFMVYDGVPVVTNLDTGGIPHWCIGMINNTNSVAETNCQINVNGTSNQ